ncbi:hypothetical protein H0O00_01465 [Candidatus Micrarchaeota archaeon]|nr:hypothetical protein [Candidatus Micrarchaeota archaeon]
MPEPKPFVQWSGCATYNQAIYHVMVVAPKDAGQGDVCRAISTAGGFNPRVENDHPDKALIQAATEGTKFVVEFIPDKRYTNDFPTKKTVMVLLSASNKKLHDGDFQKPAAALHQKQNLASCPTRATSDYQSSVGKQFSRAIYPRR